jgi:hypothetical protein
MNTAMVSLDGDIQGATIFSSRCDVGKPLQDI